MGAVQPDLDRLRDALRDAEVRGEQVRGPCRNDGHRRVRTGDDVDAPLHHPVAAPDEDQVGALLEGGPELLWCQTALRDFQPEWIVDAPAVELLPQRRKAAVEALARVCDDGDGAHAGTSAARRSACRTVRSSATLRAVRAAKSATQIAPTPISAPAITSMGWCSPR